MSYPANVPIGTQIQGDCAVTVCDGSGGTTKLFDSADAQQIQGDCKTTVCIGVGQTTQQSDAADVPPGTECTSGACSATGPTQQPVADGTKCSIGLCKAGACVKFIPVCCTTKSGGSYCGCDGNPNPAPVAIHWNDATGAHVCALGDATAVDYCKPGTLCTVSAFGTAYTGVCE